MRGGHNKKLSPEDVKSIRDQYARGARQTDLARHFGVSQSCISFLVRGSSYTKLPGPRRSAFRPRLTPTEVARVRDMVKSGISYAKISAAVDRNVGQISYIARGLAYRDQPGAQNAQRIQHSRHQGKTDKIVAMASRGARQVDIASALHVSQSTVSVVLARAER